MKVRPQMAVSGKRISCPVCHSPIAVYMPSDAESPEFRAELPQATPQQPAGAQTRRHPAEDSPEFAPSRLERPSAEPPAGFSSPEAPPPDDGTFLRNLKHAEEQTSGQEVRVTVRRRKRIADRALPIDWNSSVDDVLEAEVYADPWIAPVPIPEEVITQKESEFVVSEHMEDGQLVTRMKRVRKRRIIGMAQLFFRRLSIGTRIACLTLVAAIAVGGMWYGIAVFRKKFTPVTYEDAREEFRPNRGDLASQDEAGAVEVLTAFLAADGAQAKLPHVRLPHRVLPLMEEWYQKHPDKPAKAGEVTKRDKILAGGLYLVLLQMEVVEPDPLDPALTRSVAHFYAVEEMGNDTERSYKVDWETAVEWRPMSFEEFKLERPRRPVPFRLKLRSDDYYNHSFIDTNKWLSAELYYPCPDERNPFQFHGYLDKRSRAYRDLAIYTEPGNKCSVIINLRYPDDAVSSEQVIIDSMEHPSWFYTEDKPPSAQMEGKGR